MLKRKYHPNAGEKYYNERSDTEEAIDTVVAELEKPTYTAQDMEDFAEWCDDLSLYYHSAVDNIWIKMGDEGERFTTAQLREIWEKERKEES